MKIWQAMQHIGTLHAMWTDKASLDCINRDEHCTARSTRCMESVLAIVKALDA